MGCRGDQSGNLRYGFVRTRGLCAVFVHAGKKLKIPFTRRAKSHEIMIMLFRGEHMGNSSAAATATSWFMFNFSISPLFLCALRSFLYLLTCGFGYFLRNKPNKSLEIFLVLTSRLVFSPLFFSWLNLRRMNLLMKAMALFTSSESSRGLFIKYLLLCILFDHIYKIFKVETRAQSAQKLKAFKKIDFNLKKL